MKLKLKKQEGITLASLIITVVVIGIIAGTATYTGFNVYQDAKTEAIIQELQMIQVAVENEYGKILLEDYDYTFYGTDLRDDRQGLTNAFGNDDDRSPTNTIKGYKELTPLDLKEKLNLNGVTRTVYVNFLTCDVRDKKGFEYNGDTVYSLREAGLINQELGTAEDVDYVKDGLCLYLDGIDSEFDTEASKWKDISGNSNDVEFSLVDDAVYFDEQEKGLVQNFNERIFTPNNQILLLDGYTINIVYKVNGFISNTNYKQLFNNASSIGFKSMCMQQDASSDGSMLFYTHGKSGQVDGQGGDVVTIKYNDGSAYKTKPNKTYSLNWTMWEDEVNYHKNIFLDGKEIYWADKNREQKLKNGVIPENALYGAENYEKYRTLSSWSNSGEIDMVIYAIRVYDRTLTKEEIAHNYYVDSARFGLY